jgi:hypothetical protein
VDKKIDLGLSGLGDDRQKIIKDMIRSPLPSKRMGLADTGYFKPEMRIGRVDEFQVDPEISRAVIGKNSSTETSLGRSEFRNESFMPKG